jgi:alcohol dehydrogenase
MNEPMIPRFILQLIFGFERQRKYVLGMVTGGIVERKGIC